MDHVKSIKRLKSLPYCPLGNDAEAWVNFIKPFVDGKTNIKILDKAIDEIIRTNDKFPTSKQIWDTYEDLLERQSNYSIKTTTNLIYRCKCGNDYAIKYREFEAMHPNSIIRHPNCDSIEFKHKLDLIKVKDGNNYYCNFDIHQVDNIEVNVNELYAESKNMILKELPF